MMYGFVAAHGYDPGPSQRPLAAGHPLLEIAHHCFHVRHVEYFCMHTGEGS